MKKKNLYFWDFWVSSNCYISFLHPSCLITSLMHPTFYQRFWACQSCKIKSWHVSVSACIGVTGRRIIQAARISHQLSRLRVVLKYMRRVFSRPINQQEPRKSRWANTAVHFSRIGFSVFSKKQPAHSRCASRNAVLALRNGKAERAKTNPFSVSLGGVTLCLMRMSVVCVCSDILPPDCGCETFCSRRQVARNSETWLSLVVHFQRSERAHAYMYLNYYFTCITKQRAGVRRSTESALPFFTLRRRARSRTDGHTHGCCALMDFYAAPAAHSLARARAVMSESLSNNLKLSLFGRHLLFKLRECVFALFVLTIFSHHSVVCQSNLWLLCG